MQVLLAIDLALRRHFVTLRRDGGGRNGHRPALARALRVLGTDEFAPRRGHSYGTLLVDVETRRPADVLPERFAESSAAWLAARPGAELT